MNKCIECGKPLDENFSRCVYCGAKIDNKTLIKQEDSFKDDMDKLLNMDFVNNHVYELEKSIDNNIITIDKDGVKHDHRYEQEKSIDNNIITTDKDGVKHDHKYEQEKSINNNIVTTDKDGIRHDHKYEQEKSINNNIVTTDKDGIRHDHSYNYTYKTLTENKSRTVAGVLAIFFGGIGLHNFYLGYYKKAIAQIFVTIFLAGLGFIWGIIDAFLLFGKVINKDAMGKDLVE